MAGAFITFEGGEGSGKSTQVALLEKSFAAAGLSCLRTREPGGSPGAEKIRALLVNGDADAWDADTETLLFYAARLDHVQRVVRPALAAGTFVLCDRFADSTIVYQGAGRQVPADYIEKLHKLTLGDFAPKLTLVLDIAPEEGLKRAAQRRAGEARFESMDTVFHHKVREGFLAIARNEPQRCAVIDAAQGMEEIHRSIITLVNQRLGVTLAPCQS